MTYSQIEKIANSANPFIETSKGLTRVFFETLNKDDSRKSLWIEYINDYGFTTIQKVGLMQLNAYLEYGTTE